MPILVLAIVELCFRRSLCVLSSVCLSVLLCPPVRLTWLRDVSLSGWGYSTWQVLKNQHVSLSIHLLTAALISNPNVDDVSLDNHQFSTSMINTTTRLQRRMASNSQQFKQNANDVTAKQTSPSAVCLYERWSHHVGDRCVSSRCLFPRWSLLHGGSQLPFLAYVRLNIPTMSSAGSRRLERMLTAAFSSGFQFVSCAALIQRAIA